MADSPQGNVIQGPWLGTRPDPAERWLDGNVPSTLRKWAEAFEAAAESGEQLVFESVDQLAFSVVCRETAAELERAFRRRGVLAS